MPLNWNDIRPLNGSQATGFEELCAQLARVDGPETSTFVRKGAPDAGVECYCVLADGSEWGWQAKYFLNALSRDQWRQLDRSIKTALEKHPLANSLFGLHSARSVPTRVSKDKRQKCDAGMNASRSGAAGRETDAWMSNTSGGAARN